MVAEQTIQNFADIRLTDVEQVGGKNASLGELIGNLSGAGVQVPGGFATTAAAYWQFLKQGDLNKRIFATLDSLDVNNVPALSDAGQSIRQWIIEAALPDNLVADIQSAYQALCSADGSDAAVAVRSSATAEDLPDASFAGQQETLLNVRGIDNVLVAVKQVFASLFTDRAISYRVHQGFAHDQVALSVGIQRMVRSDIGSSGVMFTLDTESGFDKVILITSVYGLGETIVQGSVDPDEFYVYKPALRAGREAILRRSLGAKQATMIYDETANGKTGVKVVESPSDKVNRFSLNDAQITQLANYGLAIEAHYGCPMDIEWGLDGQDGQLYILQARPETVKSRESVQCIERYQLNNPGKQALVQGRAIGQRVGHGKVAKIQSLKDMDKLQSGDVLVTDMTDPNWEPIMARAAAIVTNRGGRTCHAAIIARELGIPAVVGCGNATHILQQGDTVTVSCAQGDTGAVYPGKVDFTLQTINIDTMPTLPFKIMMNVANPDRAFDFRKLPNAGVGLARLEFIINHMIGIHPQALLDSESLDEPLRSQVQARIKAYGSGPDFYVDRLAEGIATLACAFDPKPIIVRLSDFKSNEYASLLGGEQFEPKEENPMLGFRGAARYVSPSFGPCFKLECKALVKARQTMGLNNIQVMVPFVRTLAEGQRVIELLADNGLKQGEDGLKIIMMCELPSNAILADEFLQIFDGFSIGSNDLTQLTLGLDRDSAMVAEQFDERNAAVKALLSKAIQACKKAGKYIGICGQGPSDYPDFAEWLMQEGIDSVSLNPDSVLETWLYLAKNDQ